VAGATPAAGSPPLGKKLRAAGSESGGACAAAGATRTNAAITAAHRRFVKCPAFGRVMRLTIA
jgi:hypothetical protein